MMILVQALRNLLNPRKKQATLVGRARHLRLPRQQWGAIRRQTSIGKHIDLQHHRKIKHHGEHYRILAMTVALEPGDIKLPFLKILPGNIIVPTQCQSSKHSHHIITAMMMMMMALHQHPQHKTIIYLQDQTTQATLQVPTIHHFT